MAKFPITKSTPEVEVAVLQAVSEGMSKPEVAKKFEMSTMTVYRIVRRAEAAVQAAEASKNLSIDRLSTRGKTVASLKHLTPKLLKGVADALKAAKSNPEQFKAVDQAMRAAGMAEKMSLSASSDGTKGKGAPGPDVLRVFLHPSFGPKGMDHSKPVWASDGSHAVDAEDVKALPPKSDEPEVK